MAKRKESPILALAVNLVPRAFPSSPGDEAALAVRENVNLVPRAFPSKTEGKALGTRLRECMRTAKIGPDLRLPLSRSLEQAICIVRS